ncbi:MAG TPA: chalcone isomerase family protein, partial [Acetobacteraceae bacterium]
CPRPCRFPDGAIERFLAAVPAVRQGDRLTLLFTAGGMDFFMNGRPIGSVKDQDFARLILATFIGQHPSSEEVKFGLLGASG